MMEELIDRKKVSGKMNFLGGFTVMEYNTIICGDSLEVLKTFPDSFIDCVVTSPPYYAGKEYEDTYKTQSGYEKYLNSLINIFIESERVLKPGGHLWINVDDVHTSLKSEYKRNITLPTHAFLTVELSKVYDYKDLVLWRKIRGKHASGGASRLLGSYGRFGSPGSIPIVGECEFILWFKKKGKRTDITDEMRKLSSLTSEEFKVYGMQVWEVRPENALRAKHPAPFPEEIPARIIKLSTFVGDLVLDPFVGSGTTAVAAKKLGRNFIGIDINLKYCEIANARLNSLDRKE